MECLSMNLNYWNSNPGYTLYYNSNHVICIESEIDPPETYIPLEDFGISYFTENMNKNLLSEYDISLLECYMTFKKLEKESHKYMLNTDTSISSIYTSIENNNIPLYWDGKYFSNVIHNGNFRNIIEFGFDKIFSEVSEFLSNDNIRKLKICFDIHKANFDKTIFVKKYKTLFNDVNNISMESLVEMKNDLEFLLKQ